MSKTKAAIYNAITNFVNLIFSIITGIILVPIYFKFFSIETYGSWLASGNIILMLTVIESGLSFVLTQKLSVAYQTKDKLFFIIFTNASIIYFLLALIILCIGLLILPFIPDIVNISETQEKLFILGVLFSLIASALTFIQFPFLVISQVYQKTFAPGLINIIGVACSVLTIFWCLYHNLGVASIGLGYLIRSIIVLVCNFIYSINLLKEYKSSKIEINRGILKFLIKEISLPFISKLSLSLLNNTQNLLIAILISPAFTTIYDLTAKVTIILKSLMNILSISTFSGFSLKFAEQDKREIKLLISKFLLLYSTIMAISYGFSFTFSKIILHYWVGDDKFGGYTLLFFIVLSSIIADSLALSNMFAWSSGNYKKGALYDVINAVIFLTLSILFCYLIGVIGIPLAAFISGLIVLVLIQRNILNKLHISVDIMFIPYKKPILYSFIFTLIFVIIINWNYNNLNFLTSVFLATIYIVLLFLFILLFSPNHRNELFSFSKKLIFKK